MRRGNPLGKEKTAAAQRKVCKNGRWESGNFRDRLVGTGEYTEFTGSYEERKDCGAQCKISSVGSKLEKQKGRQPGRENLHWKKRERNEEEKELSE